MAKTVIASTCKECSVRCGSLIYMQDDKVVKITGNPRHPGSRGAFCIKGVQAPVTAREHPERPVHPLRRTGERGEGKWEQVSWDTALGEIAERIGMVKRQYGPLAVAGAVSNHFVSRGVAMTQLLRSVGSPNYMINQDLWLQIKPGTDAALALSMIHVMFSEKLIDHGFVEQWCTGTEKLRERGLLDFELLPWNSHRELLDFQLKATGVGFDELCKTNAAQGAADRRRAAGCRRNRHGMVVSGDARCRSRRADFQRGCGDKLRPAVGPDLRLAGSPQYFLQHQPGGSGRACQVWLRFHALNRRTRMR